jgi:DNA modification methylase
MATTAKKISKKTLPQEITTQELMKVDFHFNYSQKEMLKDWAKLKKETKFKTGSQYKPGLKICQHFCRNFFDIETKNGKSFTGVWNDPILMDKIRLWGLEKMSQLYISWLRRAVYMASGMHNPSFYRPHLAKQIILSTNKVQGRLFDPCAGWGGRMLGTVAAGWQYIGCEPNKVTYDHLMEIVEFLDIGNFVNLYNVPYEDLDLTKMGEVDIVLTSPPYFDLELYSSDTTQSYLKYNDYNEWMDKWYLPMIQKNISILVPDGVSCYNVMNGRCENIVEKTIEQHQMLGLDLINQIGIDSPFKNYKKKLTKSDLTYVFKKI